MEAKRASPEMARTSLSSFVFPEGASQDSSSALTSKWSSAGRLFWFVTMMISSMPDATASSTTYCNTGLSQTGSISLGSALVCGKNRVPNHATGMIALRTFCMGKPFIAASIGYLQCSKNHEVRELPLVRAAPQRMTRKNLFDARAISPGQTMFLRPVMFNGARGDQGRDAAAVGKRRAADIGVDEPRPVRVACAGGVDEALRLHRGDGEGLVVRV